MHRITVRSFVVAVGLGVLLAAPGSAAAGGCEVLGSPRDRAECTARAAAREAARDEVERQVSSAGRADRDASSAHSAAWGKALEQADGVDVATLLEPRLVAAVGGLVWFLLALRVRRRSRIRG